MVASNCLGRKWRDYVIYIYASNICLILHDFHPEGLGISLLTFPHAWFTNAVFSNSRQTSVTGIKCLYTCRF